jgi:Right handed beta helix region
LMQHMESISKTDNIRLVGKPTGKNKVIVRYLPNSEQQVGIYFAPSGCDYNSFTPECDGTTVLTGISISGIVVEGFPRNGIQTRRVDQFKILGCESVDNLQKGIFPTLSTNGLIKDNIVSGSKDVGMWSLGCDNLRILKNVLFDCVVGLQLTVSNKIWVRNNDISSNTVGVALFHPNTVGLAVADPNNKTALIRPIMKDWYVENNDIYSNNRENDSVPGALNDRLPKGIGVFILGTSKNIVRKNRIRDNGTTGLGVIGFCTGQALGSPDRACSDEFPPFVDPSSNNNFISQNTFQRNGLDQAILLKDFGIPGTDILYIQSPTLFSEMGDGNCFDLKKQTTKFAIYDFNFSLGQDLPNGCTN